MPVNFVYNKGINELEMILFTELMLKLKKAMNKEKLDIISVEYNYQKLLKEYTREQITESIKNILNKIHILKEGDKDYEKLIIGIKIAYNQPKVTVQFFNVYYLKENFFVKK